MDALWESAVPCLGVRPCHYKGQADGSEQHEEQLLPFGTHTSPSLLRRGPDRHLWLGTSKQELCQAAKSISLLFSYSCCTAHKFSLFQTPFCPKEGAFLFLQTLSSVHTEFYFRPAHPAHYLFSAFSSVSRKGYAIQCTSGQLKKQLQSGMCFPPQDRRKDFAGCIC